MRKGRMVLEDILDSETEKREKERYQEIVAIARKQAHEAQLFFKEQELGKKSKVFLLQLWELIDKALTEDKKRRG